MLRIDKRTQQIQVMVNGQLHSAMHEVRQLRATIRSMQELGIAGQLSESAREMTVPSEGHHHDARTGEVDFRD